MPHTYRCQVIDRQTGAESVRITVAESAQQARKGFEAHGLFVGAVAEACTPSTARGERRATLEASRMTRVILTYLIALSVGIGAVLLLLEQVSSITESGAMVAALIVIATTFLLVFAHLASRLTTAVTHMSHSLDALLASRASIEDEAGASSR